MPVSKNRRKNGKKVKHSPAKRDQRLKEIEADLEYGQAGVSLQDLINVVAAQEHAKDGTIVADDVKVDMPEEVPVYDGEGEDRKQIGTAARIPGDDDHVSIKFDDPEAAKIIRAASGSDYSIEENQDGR